MQENLAYIALAIQMIAVVVIAVKTKPDHKKIADWFNGL